MSQKTSFTVKGQVTRKKHRALELFAHDSPFKQKVINKTHLARKPKHKEKYDEEDSSR